MNSLLYSHTFFRLARSQNTPTSTSGDPVIGTGDSLPTATSPACTQLRQLTDLPATSTSRSLASPSTVSNACNVSLQATTAGLIAILYYAYVGRMFNTSHPTNAHCDGVASLDTCPETSDQIIAFCIGNTAPIYCSRFWQGSTSNYSVTKKSSPQIR